MDFLLALTTPLWSRFPFLTPELSFGIQTEMRSITPDNRIWNDNQTNSEVSCQAVNSVERDVNKSFVVLGSACYYISMYLIWNIYHLQKFHMQHIHYSDVIMSVMASGITGVAMVCLTVCLGADQRKYQSPVSLAFVWGESTGDQWIPLTKGQ